MNLELLVSIAIGIGVFSYYLFFITGSKSSGISRRLKDTKEKKLFANRNESDIFKKLEEQNKDKKKNTLNDLLNDESEFRLAFMERILKGLSLTTKVRLFLKKADIKMPIDLFFLLILGLFTPFLLLFIANGSILFLIPGFIAMGIPFFFIKQKIDKNLDKFSAAFPDTLSLISNALKAGHSLLSSFNLVVDESPYPINKLFKAVADDISLGRDVREALEDMSKSIEGSQDLKFFITAILIQKEIGGNLADILDTLNNTIRERFKLLGMIKTQTAQAKVSGIVLGLAPVCITGLITLINPTYMQPLFSTFAGNCALFVSLGLCGLGFFVINKITQIRV